MDVKKMREDMGVTQQELAQLCGVSIRTVQNWEIGKAIPDSMVRLLEAVKSSRDIVKSGDASGNGTSIALGQGSQVTLNPDTKLFFSTLEKQQDIMSKQLEELVETRKLIQKKDEQIDALLKLIQQRQ